MGPGPAQAATDCQGPPSIDSRSNSPSSIPRPLTTQAVPSASTTSARRRARNTAVGDGGGNRPGQGAPPGPAAWEGGLPQGTSADWSAGSRPPCTPPTRTASPPNRSCTRANERAARVSAAEVPPKNPGWYGGGSEPPS